MRNALRIIVIGFLIITLLGLTTAGTVALYFLQGIPTLDEVRNRQVAQSTKIFDREGKVLLYEISAGEKRTVVPLENIPQFVRDATVVTEDENFYTQPGFDWKAIVRAMWANFKETGNPLSGQGASTISQQLVKNAFLSPEQTISRKLKELVLSVKLTNYYSKDQILELYFNEIPYGSTLYGIEAASQAYFAKPVEELTLAEGAVLAALPNAPTYYSPWGANVEKLFERQKFILGKMLAHGKITQDEHDTALKEKITFNPPSEGILAPHFVIMVQDYLTKKYGEEVVRKGGLKVTTSLDWKLQEAAEKAVKDGVARNRELYNGKNGALVAIDPKTGQVLALVGSYDYFDTENDGNFNVAAQGLRQPGSALKPFAYLTAFEKGYTPDTILFDVPTNFDTTGNPDRAYAPQNFDDLFRGPVSMGQALAQSINVPAVKTLYLISIEDMLRTMEKLGVKTLNDPRRYGLSLVLGGGEVRLLELVRAYGVLAQEGNLHDQSIILKVEDAEGEVLEEFEDSFVAVANPEATRQINDVLTDLGFRSGLFQSSLNLTIFPGHEVALKTGTTNDYKDAWAFGYTPSLVVGVWAGNNDNVPMQQRGSSILAAIPMWNAFLSEALKNYPPEVFARPSPSATTNPIFKGNYAPDGTLHTILHHIDRDNPTGPPPTNPASDPQYINWENGLRTWIGTYGINLPKLPSSTVSSTNSNSTSGSAL
ncbi:MAG: transglycosylase domain-containing protein [Anaplasmataceae bacterium]|nr:transglycosylase domain-containing protein [Anaplasmataceae bacterium]